MDTIVVKNTTWKLTEFISELAKFNDAYRKGSPIISDKQYDNLVDELRAQHPDHDWFWKPEPAFVPENRKVKLPVLMKSLDKIKTEEDFYAWVRKCGLLNTHKIVCMPKFDGCSLLVEESTAKGYTRGGDVNEGQSCDKHIMRAGVNTNNKYQYTFGEFVISKSSWLQNFDNKINPKSKQTYKSPRNTAVGMLNSPTPPSTIKHATFFRYGASGWRPECSTFSQFIANMCSDYNQEHLYKTISIGEWSHELMQQLYTDWSLLYGIDGVVIYVDDIEITNMLGRHESNGNPLYAVAYKGDFEESMATVVLGVQTSVSKNGYLRPTIMIEPVTLANATIANPTGNNMKFVINNKIAQGSVVEIIRSGEVIPKIKRVTQEASEESMQALLEQTSRCPSCLCPTQWNESGTDIMCTNPSCSGIRFAKMLHFFSTIGCFGVGEDIYGKLFHSGFDSIKKILNLTLLDICSINGFSVGIARNLLDTNAKVKAGIDLDIAIHASDCFENIGQRKAQKLLDQYQIRNTSDMLTLMLSGAASNSGLSKTEEFFFAGIPKFIDMVSDNCLVCNDFKINFETNANGMLSGSRVCFSGIRNKDLEEFIVCEGGKVCTDVSAKTTHLIVADKSQQTSKLKKALQLNVPIMTLSEFQANI